MPRRKPKPQQRRGRGARPLRPEADLDHQAELLQRRRANCAAKARYETEAEARSHALMHSPGPGPRSQAYRCDVCEGWHLTRG